MARVAALLLLVFGLLPIANWMPGGREVPWYGERLELWVSGLVIVLGVSMLATVAVRRWPGLWRRGAWGRIAGQWQRAGWRGDLALAVVALVCYALIAKLVFMARPLVIDEIVQTFQARIFASGRLWLPIPEVPALRSSLFVVDVGSRLYGQFPAGGPAMIALGSLAGVEWLVGPIFGALSVFLFARLLRRMDSQPGTALAGVLLFGGAPFVAFMAGTLMNHVTALTFLLAAALGLAHATPDAHPRPWSAFACGLALGMAAMIRPLDGMIFAVPTAVWLLVRLRLGRRHAGPLLASGAGVLLPLLALCYVNWQQTGSPTVFGYQVLWGAGVGLGFGTSPWGAAHSPALGLEFINLYLLQLQSFLFETPLPGLLFATGALALTRIHSAMDRWVLWGSGLLLVGYFAYWHDGYHLGPRFLYPLTPWLALWTARLPAALRERRAPAGVQDFVVTAGALALLLGATQMLPIRVRAYRAMEQSAPGSFDAAAREAGIHDATIMVRETWGAQLIARLWALGVSRPLAESYYRTTDACALETAITTVERRGGGAAELTAALATSRADTARLVGFTGVADTTLRALPGSEYSYRCVRRLAELELGRTNWAPALLVHDDNTWIRDLHELSRPAVDTLRPVWLLTRGPPPEGAPVFTRVDVDSMRREWTIGDD